MSDARTLGSYRLAPDVDDEINYNSGDRQYMVLRAEDDDEPVYGDATFVNGLKRAHSDADWAASDAKLAIVVDMEQVLRLAWTALPVVYDTTDDDES